MPERVNNHRLSLSRLQSIYAELTAMTMAQRERLTGMEPGRGDLILPGLDVLLRLLPKLQLTEIVVADAGLLEGLFLSRNCAD